MKTITKSDLRKLVYEKVRGIYTTDAVYWIVQTVFECMEEILRDGDKLVIMNSFSLEPKLKKAKPTGNFGNKCIIPARYVPYFKPSKKWKAICKEMDAVTFEKEEEIDENA